MKINIYYGGRGMMDDPTLFVISKMQEILEELNVKVERYNLYELKREISSLPSTMNDADGIILASTVEWYGIGGYMYQFLDACWLYGDKEKISKIYMCPIVMSTTYGEREGKLNLAVAWETLGGLPCSGLCGYIKDTTSFELNVQYVQLIEKKAENMYRTISQRIVSLPASNKEIKQMVSTTAPLPLTPQETEQLSKYASDEEYVKTQKEDIKELASHFKTMLGSSDLGEDYLLKLFRDHFVPQKNFQASYKIMIDGEKNALIIKVKDGQLDLSYGALDNPSILCKITRENLDSVTSGRMTFQRAFMTNCMQVKGDFKILRMLDTVFAFS